MVVRTLNPNNVNETIRAQMAQIDISGHDELSNISHCNLVHDLCPLQPTDKHGRAVSYHEHARCNIVSSLSRHSPTDRMRCKPTALALTSDMRTVLRLAHTLSRRSSHIRTGAHATRLAVSQQAVSCAQLQTMQGVAHGSVSGRVTRDNSTTCRKYTLTGIKCIVI